MKMKIAGAAAAVILAAALPASASIVKLTYIGTVSSGYDYSGVFGPIDTALNGDSFVAKFVFDTSKGIEVLPPVDHYVSGGTLYGAPSPSLSASLEINGITITNIGNYQSQLAIGPDGFGIVEASLSHNYIQNSNGIFDFYLQESGIRSDGLAFSYPFNSPYSGSLLAGSGSFNVSYFNYATYSALANAQFSVSNLIVSTVPEPSTWSLMLVGFGGLGLALRSRLRQDVAAA